LEVGLSTFEECLQRLELIVKDMECGDLPLEQSLKLFEEGIALSASCKKELDDAEAKVEILLKNQGKMQAEPFGESGGNR
jgi:exodeoxyribonuclease VII small subunit